MASAFDAQAEAYSRYRDCGRATLRRKVRWWFRSALKNARMGKYRSIARYFYDSGYRADIHHMMDLLCWGRLRLGQLTLKLGQMHAGHSVTYPGWVDELVRQERGGDPLEPVKVYYDYVRERWTVIDGNHRLAALKQVYDEDRLVLVGWLHHEENSWRGEDR